MQKHVSVRSAEPRDAKTIADFNIAMAWETEKRALSSEIVSAGVEATFKHAHLGFYVVAERSNEIVGSLMITTEWSDWRNGVYWWIQSVYVRPEFRRQGIYRKLYEYVRAKAAKARNVCGFRLYVERENTVAQNTYKNLGMVETHYRMYEELAGKTRPQTMPLT
jgi:ribosomal protein S18 acetylase RimI-like enzyme